MTPEFARARSYEYDFLWAKGVAGTKVIAAECAPTTRRTPPRIYIYRVVRLNRTMAIVFKLAR